MCSSVDPDLFVDSELTESRKSLERTCSKCKHQTPAVFIHGNAICKECFIKTSEHKFRAEFIKFLKELGKSRERLASQAKKILFAFSGGINSVLLLFLLANERKQKRISTDLNISLVFVWNSKMPDGWPELVTAYMRKNAEPFTFETISLKYLDDEFVSSVTDSDALYQATTFCRNRTLSDYAKSTNCDGIIFASSQTTLANELVCNVSLGYAERIAHISTNVDKMTCFGMPVGRPFRVLTAKEITFLVRFLAVEPLSYPTLSLGRISGAVAGSVGSVCESMMAEVGAEYPATASAVFKTGTKLDTGVIDHTDDRYRCKICYCCIDSAILVQETSVCYGCQQLELSKFIQAT